MSARTSPFHATSLVTGLAAGAMLSAILVSGSGSFAADPTQAETRPIQAAKYQPAMAEGSDQTLRARNAAMGEGAAGSATLTPCPRCR